MHDVKTKPTSLSPLDEIQYFSLIDLRRLSSKPAEAVARLKQKFINLKDESFVLFMDSGPLGAIVRSIKIIFRLWTKLWRVRLVCRQY